MHEDIYMIEYGKSILEHRTQNKEKLEKRQDVTYKRKEIEAMKQRRQDADYKAEVMKQENPEYKSKKLNTRNKG